MCIWDLAVFQCGHNGNFTRRDGGCALPTRACDKEIGNAVRHQMPWNCDDCVRRLRRGVPFHPEDNIHPLGRSVQQPMLPVALPPQAQAVSRRAKARKGTSSTSEQQDGDAYDFSEFAPYANYPTTLPQKRYSGTSPTKVIKRQRNSRNTYSSDTPRMFGRLGNIAQDLSEIAMPAASEQRRSPTTDYGYSPTNGRGYGYGNVYEMSDIPPNLIPGIPTNTSPTRRRNDRSPLLYDGAGVSKRRKPSYPSARRISPTQAKAPHNSPSTCYGEASQAATRQKQAASRAYRDIRDDVERMIQTGRHSREEIMRTAKFASLNERDQRDLLWQYGDKLQARENAPEGKREGRTKRDACVVM
ncbi:uncharacterized protein Z519_07481 [Cladophialophora bantiana CBS 173.52]|uniref:Uncharacterized protein n=1 Tax=Cladophialophora bantiana (strain ATCC 10958 / CBS 173.52 / CDC B-1940 / NIH 8579) TaxID=1442370 RepID=A0A0D2HLB3_CLAB1|nr:uncharacterized protein Z519_07481 [Cladophialophora bantiana CBS 173.52]KIW91515.1 hypothetical protein Z519_07481 [Cladophialophora bantiana CBS 173.52]